jgi:hypothetical protein
MLDSSQLRKQIGQSSLAICDICCCFIRHASMPRHNIITIVHVSIIFTDSNLFVKELIHNLILE